MNFAFAAEYSVGFLGAASALTFLAGPVLSVFFCGPLQPLPFPFPPPLAFPFSASLADATKRRCPCGLEGVCLPQHRFITSPLIPETGWLGGVTSKASLEL